jgi:ABC-2 type transport system permease protein
MKTTFTIAWRDFRSLMQSPMMYVILGLCSFLLSLFHIRNLGAFTERSRMLMPGQQGPSLQLEFFAQHISLVHLLLILVTPVLTMRLLAEEKKMKTFDLLLTSPITATQIAAGKFLAGFYCAFVLVAISFVYPASMATVTEVSWPPLLSAYLGLMLVVSIYVAIGLFSSSLTESVVLSVVLGWVLNLTFFFLGQAGAETTDQFWAPIVQHISMPEHFYSFILGEIRTKSLIYLASVTALFVFLTQRVVESARWR